MTPRERALAAAESFAELEGFGWPSVDDLDYSGLREECERHEQHALMYGSADVWQRPAHLFQPDVPPENIVAMYDRAP